MARTITSANSVLLLSIESLFNTPQQLQGFAADDVTDTETIAPAEVSMGVDGHLSGGFVFVPIRQNISLQADSLSNDVFDAWYAAEQKARESYIATGQIQFPSLGKKYVLTRGFLTSVPPTAAARRTMQARRYQITWESISPAPY